MDTNIFVDKSLEMLWNEHHLSDQVRAESFWEFCRCLENAGYLEGNKEFVGTKSLGPFRIAYKADDIDSGDIISFLLSSVVPILLQLSEKLPFSDFYALYLLPVGNIIINAQKRILLVKDPLQWDLLLYVKNENKENVFPTEEDILMNERFKSIPDNKIREALKSLTNKSTLLGKTDLIHLDHDGRIECLV